MSPGIHPGINHTHAQTPSSFFLPFSTANGHFSRPTSLSDSHKVAAKAYVFLLGKKYSVLKGRKRRLLLLSGFFCGSGPTGIRGEMEQKRSVFFFGSNSSGFFCGVFSSLPLPTWTPKKEDELCKHFLLEYAAKARQIE